MLLKISAVSSWFCRIFTELFSKRWKRRLCRTAWPRQPTPSRGRRIPGTGIEAEFPGVDVSARRRRLCSSQSSARRRRRVVSVVRSLWNSAMNKRTRAGCFRCRRTVVCHDGTCSAKSNASIYFYSREKNVILNVPTVLTVSGCHGAGTNKLFFLKKRSGFYSFSRLLRKSRRSAEIPAKTQPLFCQVS